MTTKTIQIDTTAQAYLRLLHERGIFRQKIQLYFTKILR